MTAAEVAALTDAEAATAVARDVMGLVRRRDYWCAASKGYGHEMFRAHGTGPPITIPVFDPRNVPAQALALFEGEH